MARRQGPGSSDVSDPGNAPAPPPRPKATQPPSSGGSTVTGTDRVFQSSERGKPLCLAYGTVRVGANIIERYDSVAVTNALPYWMPSTHYLLSDSRISYGKTYACITEGDSSSVGSRGQGPSGTGTDIVDGTVHWKYIEPGMYTALALGFCEGLAYGVGGAWQDSFRYSNYNELAAVSSNFALFLGDAAGVTRPAWFQFTGDPLPDYYSNTVVLFINGTSGADASVPNVSLEVKALFTDATHVDVSPADIAIDMLTHPRRGVLWPTARVDAVSTGSADASSWRNYCTAYGLNLSWVIDTQTDVLTLLGLLLDATNSDAVQTPRLDGLGFMLKFVPRGDQPLTANGVTFTPNTTATAIGPDDLCAPVQVQLSAPIDRYNSCPIEYVDRGGDYVRTTVDDPDMADVELRGLRRATTFTVPQVIAPESAIMLSRILAQRSLNVRRTFTLKLPDRFLLLEPTDLLTVSDPLMGLVNVPMRATAIGEDQGADGSVTITAEDWPGMVHVAAGYTPQSGDGYKPNQGTPIARSPMLPVQVPPGTFTDSTTTRGGAVHNIWPNGTSEGSPPDGADVTTAEWAAIVADSGALSGANVRRLVATKGSPGARLGDQMTGTDPDDSTFTTLSMKVACSPNQTFTLEGQMRFPVAPTGGGSAKAGWRIIFLDKNDAQVAFSPLTFTNSAGPFPTAWSPFDVTATAPTGACSALFRVVADPTLATSGDVTVQYDALSAYQNYETEADGSFTGTVTLAVTAGGNTWTDLPGVTTSFRPLSFRRKIKVSLCFSGFATGAAGELQVRIVFGGTPTAAGIARKFFYNTIGQHQGWPFMWVFSPGTFGPPGTAVTVKAQVISPTGSSAAFNQDIEDTGTIVVEEVG